MKFFHIVLFSCSIIFTSCSWFSKSSKDDGVLAIVNDHKLYKDDIQNLILPGTSSQDSIAKVNAYIQQWIKTQVVLSQAEKNIKNKSIIDEKIEAYKNSLIIYEYQQQIIAQNLDSNVTEKEIIDYYEKNKNQFILRKNLVKAKYIVYSRKSPDVEKVKQWFYSEKEEQKIKLKQFCQNNALTYQMNDTVWAYLNDIEKIIPLQYITQESFLKSTTKYETLDSSMYYLLHIKQYKTSQDVSPIEFEKERIKSLILHLRKTQILQKMEDDLYREAIEKNNIEIIK